MRECNTLAFSASFYKMVEDILKSGRNIGAKNWGNPMGSTYGLDTYEIEADGDKMWCSMIEWASGTSRHINRQGFIGTYPTKSNSLGQLVDITIPFEYSKRFNTRAYHDGDDVEIRHYGKFPVGRSGLKKKDFFDYVFSVAPDYVKEDENHEYYIPVFRYTREMTVELFAKQLIRFTKIVDSYKKKFR